MRKTIGRIGARGYQSEVGTTRQDRERLDDMLSSQTPPAGKTEDQALMEGLRRGQQFDNAPSWAFDHLVAEAKKHDPNFVFRRGMVYQPTLANFHGDPVAFVESAADVRRAAEINKKWVRGAVNDEGPEVAPLGPAEIADDLVWDGVRDRCAENPDLAAKLRESPEKIKEVFSEVKQESSGDGLYDKTS